MAGSAGVEVTPTDMSADGGFRVVVAVALLLPGTGSSSTAATLAVLAISVDSVTGSGVTVMVTVVLDPDAREPRSQTSVPPASGLPQVPVLAVADTNATPVGSVSVSVTPVAPSGPLLSTVMVYSRSGP